MALRKCLPARPPRRRSPPSPALAQPSPPAPAPGHTAAHQHMATLLEHALRTPCARGANGRTGCQGPAGNPADAMPEAVQPGWGALGCAMCSSCSAAGAMDPAQDPAPPTAGPGERPQRPAWLEEAARRISQGITLGGRASREGLGAPCVSFPESLPAASAALGVAQRSAT